MISKKFGNLEIKSVYLAENGITSSEANYLANMIKEEGKTISSNISSFKPFDITYKDQYGEQILVGDQLDSDKFIQLLSEEGKIYGLSAWLRSALKEKESLLLLIKNSTYSTFGLTKPTLVVEELNMSGIPEQDLSLLNLSELAEYYKHEALAAHIGKKVHVGGVLENLKNLVKNLDPITHQEKGQSYIRISTKSTVSLNQLDKVQAKLNIMWREAEQKVNYYKNLMHQKRNQILLERNKINESIISSNADKNRAYELAMESLNATVNRLRVEALEYTSSLKIAIPASFEEVFTQLQQKTK